MDPEKEISEHISLSQFQIQKTGNPNFKLLAVKYYNFQKISYKGNLIAWLMILISINLAIGQTNSLGTNIISGDFDGDKKWDMAQISYATIKVAFSVQDGSFWGTNESVENIPNWASRDGVKPVFGDFNGDEKWDIALVGGTDWASVPVAFSNGDGTFRVTNKSVENIPNWASRDEVKPVSGDFNGDGNWDIALVGGTDWASVPVAFSNGDGTFRVTNKSVENIPNWASRDGVKPIFGDFNGDGNWDIALVGGIGWASVPVAFSNGDGTFRVTNELVENVPTWTTRDGVKPVSGDFDGDGNWDIALVGGAGWASVPVAFSNSDGTFRVTNESVENIPNWASRDGAEPVSGDFDGDGNWDIALVGGAGWASIPVAFSNSDGTFRVTNKSTVNNPSWSDRISFSDAVFRIRGIQSGRYLHFDGGGDRVLSTKWQPNDDFTRFFFNKIGNNEYEMRVMAEEGTTISVYTFFNTVSSFEFVDKGNHIFQIKDKNSDRVMCEDISSRTISFNSPTSTNYNSSLFELEPKKRVFVNLFEHINYQGNAHGFFPGHYNVSDINSGNIGNNEVSSIKVVPGTVVTVFEEEDFQGKFRTYSSNTPYVGDEMNDEISSLVISDENDFAMIFASDSQYPRTKNGGYGDEAASEKFNRDHVKSMNKLIDIYPVMGVIMNGDFTEFGHSSELSTMRDIYGDLNTAFYPGLGNHDYENNVDDCYGNWCAERMVSYIVEFAANMGLSSNFDFNIEREYGSLAYSWDIGNVHFVQLHNYPTYETTINNINITPSLTWLEEDVRMARDAGKYIILNCHWARKANEPQLRKIINDYKVSAVFTGHTHSQIGNIGSIGTATLFNSGASFYNTYLLIRFKGDRLIYENVSSDNGEFILSNQGMIRMRR